jgi:hypothetical protein
LSLCVATFRHLTSPEAQIGLLPLPPAPPPLLHLLILVSVGDAMPVACCIGAAIPIGLTGGNVG